MSSRHLVDLELLPALDMFPFSGISAETLFPTRAGMQQMLAMAPPPLDDGTTVTERRIPGPPGAPEVRVLIYSPPAIEGQVVSLHGAYLHLHGGGYVMGVPEINDAGNRRLCAEMGVVVVSVDYRIAPETAFPGAVEDCYAALKWLHAEAEALGVDPSRIAIGGESAGGGLAACLALLARDRGEVPIVFQKLIYPMLDDRTGTTGDANPFAGEFIWTPEANRFGWASLLGREPGGSDVSPYAAAARATDLSGLPASFIAIGALDLFIDESLDYAKRLIRAGVPTELHVYPGAYHAADMSVAARMSIAFQRDSLDAMRRALQ